MSVWTHVAGIIRIDDVRVLTGHNLASVLYHFQSLVPGGSEGPLTVTGWENPDVSSLASFTISIHGDLRDFENPWTVVEWLKERCREPLIIRQGIALIHTEGQEPVVWQAEVR
jgi:hypothetical protein